MEVKPEELRSKVLAHFSCQKSGNCCRAGGYVYVSTEEINALAESLHMDIPSFSTQYVRREKGWPVIASPTFRTRCFLDDKNQCQVYSNRPRMCRTYPDWEGIWSSSEALEEEIKSCPGLKKAFLKASES